MKKIKFFKIIILLLFSLVSSFVSGQQLTSSQKLYHDFGTWSMNDGQGNKVAIRAYATVEEIKKYPTNSYEKKSMDVYIIQRYELYLISESIYQNRKTNTWINGARVYINFNDGFGKREMTAEQFPQGFMLSINTEPTLVYWYEIEPVIGLGIFISWENAIYETRIRN